jgi:aryl-alcohol dehydrogenase-like predicted oxidoreductase
VKDSATHTMYLRSNVDDNFEIIERLTEVAAKKNVKPAQAALAWLLSKPNVTAPVVGATKMYQLEEAVAAVQVKLTPEEIKYVEEPYRPHPVFGPNA